MLDVEQPIDDGVLRKLESRAEVPEIEVRVLRPHATDDIRPERAMLDQPAAGTAVRVDIPHPAWRGFANRREVRMCIQQHRQQRGPGVAGSQDVNVIEARSHSHGTKVPQRVYVTTIVPQYFFNHGRDESSAVIHSSRDPEKPSHPWLQAAGAVELSPEEGLDLREQIEVLDVRLGEGLAELFDIGIFQRSSAAFQPFPAAQPPDGPQDRVVAQSLLAEHHGTAGLQDPGQLGGTLWIVDDDMECGLAERRIEEPVFVWKGLGVQNIEVDLVTHAAHSGTLGRYVNRLRRRIESPDFRTAQGEVDRGDARAATVVEYLHAAAIRSSCGTKTVLNLFAVQVSAFVNIDGVGQKMLDPLPRPPLDLPSGRAIMVVIILGSASRYFSQILVHRCVHERECRGSDCEQASEQEGHQDASAERGVAS